MSDISIYWFSIVIFESLLFFHIVEGLAISALILLNNGRFKKRQAISRFVL